MFGKNESWSPERVRLLAYFIAEGGLTGRSARFTNADPEIVADFRGALDQEFSDCSLRVEGALKITYAARARKRSRQRNSVTRWLTDLELMGKSALRKRFPEVVWGFERRRLTEFLRVLFSCDGTIYSMGGYPRIEFAVASEGLAEDVHHALLRFGIVSKLWNTRQRSRSFRECLVVRRIFRRTRSTRISAPPPGRRERPSRIPPRGVRRGAARRTGPAAGSRKRPARESPDRLRDGRSPAPPAAGSSRTARRR